MTDATSSSVTYNKAFLIILDGYGCTQDPAVSAISKAHTPVMDRLLKTCPHAKGSASGPDVGLPVGQFGNSEVGHLNIGAGRIVRQELSRIDQSITEGDFSSNTAIQLALETAKSTGRLHIFGLLSDGGVHAHVHHLHAMISLAHDHQIPNVFVHAFTDGRDTSPSSGVGFLDDLQTFIADKPGVEIASVVGRYYAMDRDKRWERTEKAYRAMVNGDAMIRSASSLSSDIKSLYSEGITDEFLPPIVVGESEKMVKESRIHPDDPMVCINFRGDRARQLLKGFFGFEDVNFQGNAPVKHQGPVITFTAYDKNFAPYVHVAYPPQHLTNTLGEVIAAHGLRQLRVAETEKYAHVTYFMNGGIEEPNPGEERLLIPSPKVATYDLKPEMSAIELTDQLVPKIESGDFDLIVLNYANPDMVGHTGDFDAAVKAIETVDTQLGRCLDAASTLGYRTVIIADHGNADVMVKPDGSPHTAHTTAEVPIILVEPEVEAQQSRRKTLQSGKLADIAPTLLALMGLPKPKEMTGHSLLS